MKCKGWSQRYEALDEDLFPWTPEAHLKAEEHIKEALEKSVKAPRKSATKRKVEGLVLARML